jgi:hypothetical protein
MDSNAETPVLRQSFETLWNEIATSVDKNGSESAAMDAKRDTPMRQSLETLDHSCAIDAPQIISTTQPSSPVIKDALMRPSLQTLMDYPTIDTFQAVPKRPRALSESDAKGAA